MKITNNILILVIAICFSVITFNLIFENEDLPQLINFAETIAEYAGFYLLYKNGTFQRSRLSRFSRISVAMFLLGSMFKIMHWPGWAQIIIASAFSFVVLYTIHFSQKQPKQLLDFGKLLIVILVLSGKLFRLFHWKNSYELQYISSFVFLTFIIYYIIFNLRSGNLSLNN